VASLAVIVAVTLTPQQLGAAGEVSWPFTWLTTWFSDRVLNVLLYVPLGVAVALIGRAPLRNAVTVAALLLPLVVEAVQHLVGPLARDAQWQDVVDNTLGVAIGLALGYALRRWVLREAASGETSVAKVAGQ
jgi:glycopeptide antibiotics resistance protein